MQNAKRISDATGCTEELGNGWAALRDMSQEELLDWFSDQIAAPQIVSCLDGKARAILTHPFGSVAATMETCAAADALNADIASVGDRFVPVGLVGVNKAGKEREAAADFVKMLLSYDAQGGNPYASQFPVNARALDEMLAFENNNMSSGMNLDDGRDFTATWPTKARRERLGALIEALDTPLYEDAALRDMLLPEITAYLAGARSESEAGERMLSLLSTYLSE